MYPDLVDITPGTLSKSASVHQKHPPAKMATPAGEDSAALSALPIADSFLAFDKSHAASAHDETTIGISAAPRFKKSESRIEVGTRQIIRRASDRELQRRITDQLLSAGSCSSFSTNWSARPLLHHRSRRGSGP